MKTKELTKSELEMCGYNGCTMKKGHKAGYHARRERYGTVVMYPNNIDVTYPADTEIPEE